MCRPPRRSATTAWSPASIRPRRTRLGGAQARGGLLFADPDHPPAWPTSAGAISSPAPALAYQIGSKLVWRAGYGLTLRADQRRRAAMAASCRPAIRSRTPFVATLGGGVNSYIPGLPGTGTLENPYPSGILQPLGAALGPKTQVGQTVSYLNRGYEVPARAPVQLRASTTNCPGRSLVEASYVGSRTRRYPVAAANRRHLAR